MSDPGTESMLRELARDLPPVRVIPRLRALAGAVVLVWLLAIGAMVALTASAPGLAPAARWRTPDFLVVLAGLALAAGGASLAALAGAVPGRGEQARAATRWGLAGLAAAVLGGLFAAGAGEGTSWRVATQSSLGCFTTAVVLGITPAFLMGWFRVRTRAERPSRGAGWAALGAVALGSVAVHATCPFVGGLHVLLGHSLAPLWAVLLLALPASLAIRLLIRHGTPRPQP